MPAERISKVLAAAGVASRRGADALIADGRVTVDGRAARSWARRWIPPRQVVTVDGRPIGAAPASYVYLALHKPPGVASTVRDRHAARTVVELVPRDVARGARLYPSAGSTRTPRGSCCSPTTATGRSTCSTRGTASSASTRSGWRGSSPASRPSGWRRASSSSEGVATVGGLRGQTRTEDRRLADILEPRAGPAL